MLSHPLLDWLNTYGVRLFAPFASRWLYGDAVFIIDPWLWLLLGSALYLSAPHSRWRHARWAALAALLSLPVMLAPMVPTFGRVFWGAWLLAVAFAGGMVRPQVHRRIASVAASLALLYIAAMIITSRAGERLAGPETVSAGIAAVTEVMYAPTPANPFVGDLVIATPHGYHFGTVRWLAARRVQFDGEFIARGDWTSPEVIQALRDVRVRAYLVWSRFPFVRVDTAGGGVEVAFGDARYVSGVSGGGLQGVRVRLR